MNLLCGNRCKFKAPPTNVTLWVSPAFQLFFCLDFYAGFIYTNKTIHVPHHDASRRGERLGRRWLNWLQVSWPDLVSTSKSQLGTVLYTLTSVCWALCIRCGIRFSWHDFAVEGSAYFNPWTIPFIKGMIFLRPLWPFDHVLNIMLCFLCLFVLLYDIGIKFDMIWYMKQ